MAVLKNFPGTLKHQRLLQTIVAHYEHDPRILAVSVFGSLGRGDWDQFSDLDLDIVIGDKIALDVVQELERLCASFETIGQKAALIIPDGDDAGDVVLTSLMELSVRYHPLYSTSPNIIDSLQVLSGQIDLKTIKITGRANQQAGRETLDHLLDKFVRYAVEVDVALHRKQIWAGVELLHRMRGLLMELFARTHHGVRPTHAFQAKADTALQAQLGATLPGYDLNSVRESLANILNIVEFDLPGLTNDRIKLTGTHTAVLNRVRERSVIIDQKMSG